jgi:hypothetical protein
MHLSPLCWAVFHLCVCRLITSLLLACPWLLVIKLILSSGSSIVEENMTHHRQPYRCWFCQIGRHCPLCCHRCPVARPRHPQVGTKVHCTTALSFDEFVFIIWCCGQDLLFFYLMVLSKAWYCGWMSHVMFRAPVGLYLTRTYGAHCAKQILLVACDSCFYWSSMHCWE